MPNTPTPTQFPPAGWLTKKQAADILERSPSTVASMGGDALHVMSAIDPATKQTVTLYLAADVERVLEERKNPMRVVRGVGVLNSNTPTPLALPAAAEPEEEPKSKFIGATEAAKRIGVAAHVLEQAVLTGELLAIDVGADKPRFRFHVEQLDAFRGMNRKLNK